MLNQEQILLAVAQATKTKPEQWKVGGMHFINDGEILSIAVHNQLDRADNDAYIDLDMKDQIVGISFDEE